MPGLFAFSAHDRSQLGANSLAKPFGDWGRFSSLNVPPSEGAAVGVHYDPSRRNYIVC
jgi:hypothetical protein